MKHRNGTWVWVLDRGRVITRDGTGAPLMMMGTHLEITERKHREENNRLLAEVSRTLNEYTHTSINYKEIAEAARALSGASYVVINKYEPDGVSLSTVALAGVGDTADRIASLLGFSPVGKVWAPDPERTAQLSPAKTTIFGSFHGFVADVLPAGIVASIEKVFRLGTVARVAIARNERTVGDLNLFFATDTHLSDRETVELFADMVGLVMTRIELRLSRNPSRWML